MQLKIIFFFSKKLLSVYIIHSKDNKVLEKMTNVVCYDEIINKCKKYNIYQPYILKDDQKIPLNSFTICRAGK